MRHPELPDAPDRDGGELQGAARTWCARLGLGSPSQVRRLRAGRSGSLVLSVLLDSARVVVKVTDDPDRLVRAELEADLLRGEVLADAAPKLAASASGPGWVAIAMAQCEPIGSARGLDLSTWLNVAVALAALHRTPVDEVDVPRRRANEPLGDARPWAILGAADDARRGEHRLAEAGPSRLPISLEHGDSHLDNILRDGNGALVWVDWQDCGRGDGLGDLVFLWQRAEFAGGRPPRRQMTTTYAAARGLDPAQLEPDLDLVELRLLLHSWPPFLVHGSESARDVMRSRLAALVSASAPRRASR